MTKHELLEAVHAAAGEGLTRKTVADVVDTIFEQVRASIANDGKFYMPSFGTFSLRDRKARTGRNPQTGDPIQIPASKTVGFKVSSDLKAAL